MVVLVAKWPNDIDQLPGLQGERRMSGPQRYTAAGMVHGLRSSITAGNIDTNRIVQFLG